MANDLTLSRAREVFQSYWTTIHQLAYNADKDYFHDAAPQQLWIDALQSFGRLMGCRKCSRHLRAYVRHHPPPAPNRRSFNQWTYFRYSVDLHNVVNTKLGKPSMSFEQALSVYTNGEPPPPVPVPVSVPLSVHPNGPLPPPVLSSPAALTPQNPPLQNPFIAPACGVAVVGMVCVVIAAFV